MKMQRPFWLIFSLLLMLGFHQGAFAQGDEWKTFNVSNTNGGLANDDVRAIAVAGDNVWFGTHGGGLCRYQKSTDTWQNYRPTNSGIISNYVQALKSDGADLWIGTDIGVNRFTPGTDQWATWDSIYCVNSIGVDWENVWFGTSADGVFRYHKPTVQWSALDTLNSQLPGNHVASIEVMGEYVWFGTKLGAARYRPADQSWLIIPASYGGLASNGINAMAGDATEIWFGSNPGTFAGGQYTETYLNIFSATECPPKMPLSEVSIKFPGGSNPSISRYQINENKWQTFEISEPGPDTLRQEKKCYPIVAAAATRDEVWFGSISQGIYRYYKTSGTFVNYNADNSNIAGDLIWTIAMDENYVWMGTFKKGVSRYKNPTSLWRTWRKTDGLVEENVEDIAVQGDEAWFGTHRGVSRLQISTNQWTTYSALVGNLPVLLAWAVDLDEKHVWIGPVLYEYDKTANIWTKIEGTTSLLGSSNVYAIKVTDDKVWFGASEGKISCYDKMTDRWTLFDSSQTKFKGAIGTLAISERAVWFGALGNGVGCYDLTTHTWSKFDTSNSALTNNAVTSLVLDQDFVWISTSGGGINRYNTKTGAWTVFNSKNTGIIFLDACWTIGIHGDYVWCGTHSQGIYRYEKSTGLWDNFNTLNSPLVSRRVYDIETEAGFAWLCTYDPYGNKEGGVNRYGDVSPPILLHQPVIEEKPSQNSVLILATIEDNVDVKNAWIYYRSNGMQAYLSVALTRISGDSWYGQIPATDVQPGLFEYYLASSDGINTSTHPYNNPQNSPHRFKVYDSVPPAGTVSIAAEKDFITDAMPIRTSITIDGSGSTPNLGKIWCRQYADLAAQNVIDSSQITLTVNWQETIGNRYAVQGSFNTGVLNPLCVAIKIQVEISDQGHDPKGNSFQVKVLSNPLFKFTGPSTAFAQITAPDSMAIVTGLVSIKGSAQDDNLRQYRLFYVDLSYRTKIIQITSENKKETVLGLWDTEGLSEGKYSLGLEVESLMGALANDAVSVVLDTTHPRAQMTNIIDNMVYYGNLPILGTVNDLHFKEYTLEYGVGLTPTQWEPIVGRSQVAVENDTLAIWNTLGMDGYYTLRLQVLDQAGLQTNLTRLIKLDNTSTSISLISPANEQVVTATVAIHGTVSDENLAEYVLEYASEQNPAEWIEIISKTTPVNNGLLGDWNTEGLNGRYRIRLKATDQSGQFQEVSIQVSVDNLAPIALITTPVQMAQIGGTISIQGTATDLNFAEYFLEWEDVENPQIWTKGTNQRFLAPVENDVLAELPTIGKLGIYNLRMTVIDRVGHQAATQVTVEIIEPTTAQSGGCIWSPDSLVQLCLVQNSLAKDELITINPFLDSRSEPPVPADLLCPIYQIDPVKTNLKKSGLLKMWYSAALLAKLTDQRKLVITRFSETDNRWEPIGGTLNTNENSIAVAVNELGWYSLTEAKPSDEKVAITEMLTQPRIFSPRTGAPAETNITFQLQNDADVTIKVFNLAGRLVRTLCEQRFLTRGVNILPWDGRDSQQQFCLTGLYLIVIQAAQEKTTQTVMIVD